MRARKMSQDAQPFPALYVSFEKLTRFTHSIQDTLRRNAQLYPIKFHDTI